MNNKVKKTSLTTNVVLGMSASMNAAYIKYFYRAGVIDDISKVLEDCILIYYAKSY